MTDVYLLNLTEPLKGIIQPKPFVFAGDTIKIESFGEIRTKEAVVVYILAHGVPNGLKLGDAIVSESELAERLAYVRLGIPTLVVIDACFAGSIRQIDDFTWPNNFALIFSCAGHERTWHSGEPFRFSLFSDTLVRVLKPCIDANDFTALEKNLIDDCNELQTPSVFDPMDLLPVIFKPKPKGVRGSGTLPTSQTTDAGTS